MAITVEGNMSHTANVEAIKTPDGEFVFLGDRSFKNEADALGYACECAEGGGK
jgi:hypothetical protein